MLLNFYQHVNNYLLTCYLIFININKWGINSTISCHIPRTYNNNIHHAFILQMQKKTYNKLKDEDVLTIRIFHNVNFIDLS